MLTVVNSAYSFLILNYMDFSTFFLSETFKLHGEVAHQRSFPSYSDATCYLLAAVVYVLQRGCYYCHVIVSVDAAGYCKAQQVESCEAVLTCNRVAVGKQIADFASADAGFEIQFNGQCLCRELLFGHVCQHLRRVDEYGVAAAGR